MPAFRPDKRLGQHFLHEQSFIDRIGAEIGAFGGPVLEIGPGPGALTAELLRRGLRVHAVEADPRATAHLAEAFPEASAAGHLTLAEADILGQRMPEGAWTLAGNLPYNISSPILFWLLEQRTQVRGAVIMVQDEVARRLSAAPGSKVYGILSVLLALYFERDYRFRVPPGAFQPPPNVQSAVLALRPFSAPLTDLPLVHLKTVVKHAFGQRRKTLRNALKPLGKPVPEAFAGRRAESLSPAEFVTLAEALRP